ncbi:MAG TPA: GNAT family N-acetyltransferase [Candidatus Limnocylindria bacterium]|nr:GNAT family N-acetyltransferase [Candidatus Limnocylindria bacterium]
MDIQIKPLDAGLLGDFLGFFDNDAFRDNPDWSECYCQFYHYAASDPRWGEMTKDENRAQAAENVRAGVTRGYLAYMDGKVVGWCNAGPKAGYARLMGDEDLRGDEDEATSSVVCFVVDAGHRRRGVAQALLRRACEDAKARGFRYMEAYPRPAANGDADHYHGPPALFAKEGFTLRRDLGKAHIVRKELT